jgi:hypothetical protein
MIDEKKPMTEADKKTIEYLTMRISNVLEQKIESRAQRNITFLRIAVLVIIFVLAPSAWFAMRAIIHQQVNKIFVQSLKGIETTQQDLNKRILDVKQSVDSRMFYIKLSNETATINLQPYVSLPEIQTLMNDLEQISKEPKITQEPGFVFVLNNIVTILQKFGYSGFLDQIEQMFPKVVLKSRDINAKFISYYGRKILGITDIANITQSNYYKLFTKHVQIAETGNVEEDALPLQILVQFHIAGNLRNPNTDKLLRSVANLPVREQAAVLWEIMRNSNPRFWQKNPSPSDFRISKTVNKFITTYQIKLHVLAQTSGVKKTILEFYQNANTVEDQKLGKEIIHFFYKMAV